MLQSLTLSKQKSLANIIKKKLFTVPLAQFKYVNEHYGIGKVVSNKLCIREEQFNELEIIFNIELGSIDTYLENSITHKMSRIEEQEHIVSDKASGYVITSKMVKFKALSGEIFINNEKVQIPSSSNIEFDINNIKSLEVDTVIVCENLEVFLYLHLYTPLLPDAVKDYLVIYRGGAAYELCKSLGLDTIAFTDLDFQGINIACSYPNVKSVLFPDITNEMFQTNALIGQEILYQKQSHLIAKAKGYSQMHPAIIGHFDYIEKRRQGFTQELFMGRNVTLKLFKL